MMRSLTVTLCISETYSSAGLFTAAPLRPASAPNDDSAEAATLCCCCGGINVVVEVKVGVIR